MSLLDEVKQRVDIVQVVSKYADLDTSSRIPKALCPFHSERTPSFVVYPESGTWHCFGSCATGGDAVSFLMKKENIPFQEALKRLADDLGIQARDERAGPARNISDLYEANEVAARYFKARLRAPEGEAARKYVEGRGFSMEAADRRGLGLAPSGLESLGGHLKARGVDARAAVGAGLITRAQDGAWRDMFRNRLTIEIRDAQGRLCGFGARSLDGSEPKYLNTAKSDTFDKGRILYGLNWAADTVRTTGEAVVVEGYMDALAAHEHGIGNVIACMGTAITPDQLELVARLVSNRNRVGRIILCLDADSAGQESTLRELSQSHTLFQTGWQSASRPFPPSEIKAASIEGGKDPDEVIRADRAAWDRAIANAVPFLQWMINAYSARFDVSTPQGKAALFEAVKDPIYAVSNTYEQDRYLTSLAKSMGVPEQRLRAMLTRPAAGPAATAGEGSRRQASPRRTREREGRIAPSQVAAALESSGQDAIEEYLLSLLLRHEDLRDYALAVPDEHFRDAANRELFTQWRSSSLTALLQAPREGPPGGKIDQLLSRQLPPADHLQRVDAVNQCVRRLRERHLRMIKGLEVKAFSELEPLLPEGQREELRKQSLDSNSRLRQVFTGPGRTGTNRSG
ncbi:MAG: DNA primase [Dehalococcoidia bacterium]|nr:DNA primase [Dehalococcoidia bacterium]MSQ34324.1 DNA primase [Dehalococcoidia bacterium]